jgi:hypothetical protein
MTRVVSRRGELDGETAAVVAFDADMDASCAAHPRTRSTTIAWVGIARGGAFELRWQPPRRPQPALEIGAASVRCRDSTILRTIPSK